MLHNYEKIEQPKVIGFLGGLKDKARTGGLPAGIKLVEFNSCLGETMNCVIWEAPTKDALETALRQMNPTRKRDIHEPRQAYL